MTDTTYPGNYTASNGTMTIAGGDRVILSGTASLGPSLLVTGGGTLVTSGTASIGGVTAAGGVTWSDTGTVTATDVLTLAAATLRIETGGTYNVAGDFGIAAGSSGSRVIRNAGTLAKTAGWGVSHVAVTTISTGTISVADGNLRFDGIGNSFSGIFYGSGMTDYGVGSTSTLGNVDMINAACSTNFGSVNQAGTVTIGSWSTIKNLVGCTWNFTSDAGIVLTPGSSPPPTFTNKGYLDKTGGTGTTAIGIDVSNEDSATVYAATGTLSFNGASNLFSGRLTGAGTVAFGGGGSTVIGAGTSASVAHLSLTGAGTTVTVDTALSYAGGFSVGAGATLGIGAADTLTLAGATTLGGKIVLSGSGSSRATLTVNGSVAGTGMIALNGAATVALGAGAIGQTVTFSGVGNVLKLGAPAAFGGGINGFVVGDTVDLAGQTVTAMSYDGAQLTATLSNGVVEQLRLAGTCAGVSAASDGSGGTNIAAISSSFAATSGKDVVAFASGTNTVSATAATLNAGDSYVGGVGTDILAVSGGGTVNLAGSAIVRGFERLRFAAGGNYVLSTSDANVAPGATMSVDASALGAGNSVAFYGGAETDGAFSFIGGAGADTFVGGKGVDTMSGGGGNDTYWVANAADRVTEAAGAGSDRVCASTSYALAAGQSIETMTTDNVNGVAPINLTGNELSQWIYGNAGANMLDGHGGNDTLVGGRGNDVFRFDTALDAVGNVDRVTDFAVGSDMIELAQAIFQALPTGGLAASAFHVGAAAASASDRIIYNPGDGALSYDSNGSAAGGSTRFGTLSTGLSLTAGDFKVV